MAKMTLLSMVQNILSALDSDEVNSISDTVESMQVAEVVRETYDELFSNTDKPSLMALAQLDAMSDTNLPNYMLIPQDVDNVYWIKYDYQTEGDTDYQEVKYATPQEFLSWTGQRRGADYCTEVRDPSGVRFWIDTTKNPQYWTSFDNETIIFDSFDSDLDTTLQNSKSLAWVSKTAEFSLSDDYIPPIDAKHFPMLLAESKSVCFINIKQVSSAKEEQRSKRQRVKGLNDEWRLDQRRPYNRTPDYGRRSR